MNRAKVAATEKKAFVHLDTRSDALPELDAEDLAAAWDAACDDEGMDYSTLCGSRRQAPLSADPDD